HITYLYGGANYDTLDYFGAAFVGLVVFFLVFVITIVSFLNERSQGTLERLMASPLRRGEIVVGYMLVITVLALVHAAEVLSFALAILRIHNEGSVLLIFGMEALMAIAAVNLGIFLSMFARSEFQAVQFIPLVVVPQVLLSGIIFPVSTEPTILQWLSDVLPLTYAVDGMRDIMVKGADLTSPPLLLRAGVRPGRGAGRDGGGGPRGRSLDAGPHRHPVPGLRNDGPARRQHGVPQLRLPSRGRLAQRR